jgi:predicted ArsR family transcriptional regulator
MTATQKQIVVALKAQSGQTAKELGANFVQMQELVKAEVVKTVPRKHVNPSTGEPSRGRPSHEYSLTKKGRDRARRLVAA